MNDAQSKLTVGAVLEIRAAAARGENQRTIAERFGVQREAVSKIVRRKRWQHVA